MAKLTAKQQRFCEEYLVDLNATQAAIRAGYSYDELANLTTGQYYVYLLIDSRNHQIFYVGKGKGGRALSHIKNRNCNKWETNTVKNAVVRNVIAAGKKVGIYYLAQGIPEYEAFDIEGILIRSFKDYGLTNIQGGVVDQCAVNKAWAKRNLERKVPFNEWIQMEERTELEVSLYKMIDKEHKRIAETGEVWDLSGLPANAVAYQRGGELWLSSK